MPKIQIETGEVRPVFRRTIRIPIDTQMEVMLTEHMVAMEKSRGNKLQEWMRGALMERMEKDLLLVRAGSEGDA